MSFLRLYWKWIALAAVLAALTIGYNVHVNGLIKDAVTEAVTERDGEWRKSEKAAVDAAIADARAKEAKQAAEFAALKVEYDKEKANAQKANAARVAAVRAGSRLRIPSGCTGAADVPGPSNSTAGSAPAAAAQFLGEADSAFLIGEAARADEVVRQLTACQSVITSDRSP